MAEVLDNHVFGKTRNEEGYPYDQWLDGQIWKLTRDIDFSCKVQSMRINLCNAARARKIKIRTSLGSDYLIVQRKD
tara:strand:+ start:335 stop:562 length:228 start_codon:yes stop_codon:yes gene_type:complete